MRQRRLFRLVAPFVIGTLAVAACGSNKKEENGGTDAGGGPKKKATIGFISPLTGDLSALGIGMKNSIDLAIKKANQAEKIKGWELVLQAEDDTAKPDIGAQVASKLVSDQNLIAVIGTLNSSVAQTVAPVLNNANVAMVSPANTGVALTGRDNLAAQKRPYPNYVRVSTTDDVQGPFAAQYAFNTAGAKKVAIIHDKKTYGQGLALAFKGEFEKLGGTVTGVETINPGDKDFGGVLAKIAPQKPDLLYYGGEYPEASLLTGQMKQAGLKIPLMGGDGVYSGTYIDVAKDAAEGDLVTSVGAPTEELETAKTFVADYTAGGYGDPYEAYGAYAYDAANVIIDAAAKVLNGQKEITDDTRKKIIEEIGKTDMEGVTGKVAFDEFGDTTNKVLTVYKVTSGKWAAEKTDTFK